MFIERVDRELGVARLVLVRFRVEPSRSWDARLMFWPSWFSIFLRKIIDYSFFSLWKLYIIKVHSFIILNVKSNFCFQRFNVENYWFFSKIIEFRADYSSEHERTRVELWSSFDRVELELLASCSARVAPLVLTLNILAQSPSKFSKGAYF